MARGRDEADPSEDDAAEHPRDEADRGVPASRSGSLWALVGLTVLVLVVVLVFLIQNSQRVRLSFLAWDWDVSLSVALVCAAVLGALLVVLAGAARALHRRISAHRQRRARR
jgi:uncharacterized integral membrane protein